MKRVHRITLLAALLIGLLASPNALHAQETPPDCSAVVLGEALADVSEKVAEAEAFAAGNDLESALRAFNEVAVLIDEIRTICEAEAIAATEIADPLCVDYPQYCVPLTAGGVSESPDLRPAIDGLGAVPGVVRGFREDGAPFIGSPDAPIQFLNFFDFACPHCVTFEEQGVAPLIEQAVLSGQASYEMRPMAFVAGQLSLYAAYAMFCAGEQGALWEMTDALFEQYRVHQTQAYTPNGIQAVANELGLDAAAIAECVVSNRYAGPMVAFNELFTDLGLTATPSILVRHGNDEEWVKLNNRSLEYLLELVADANP